MKILKIGLKNIGPYIDDKNDIVFDVSKEKNIILIGGKNGAGKTTLLNAIKIGLFGSYAFGQKNSNASYFNSLIQIFNYVELKKKVSFYKIEVEFSIIENYSENIYKFIRKWSKLNDTIDENIEVYKNNFKLSDDQVEQIQTKLKEIIPPLVIDTMLFDGEKIAQIIDDNKISEYLHELIDVNFNINIFNKMEDDIKVYIEKEKKRNSFSVEEINLLEYKNKYNEMQKNLKNLMDVKKKYEKTLEENKFKLKGLSKRFENYGGLDENQKEKILEELNEIENARKNDLSTIKKFLEDDVIFYMNIKRLNNIMDDINLEKPILLLKYTKEIESYLGNEMTKDIKKKLQEMIGNSNNEIKYNCSVKDRERLVNIINRIKNNPVKDINKMISSTRDDLSDTKKFKKIIGNNSNENARDLNKLLIEIKDIERINNELSEKVEETDKNIKKAELDTNTALIEYETIEKKLDEDKKGENSFNVARKLLKISELYKEKQIKEYLKKISDISVMKFEEINKKDNYISKIEIDPETYDVKLFDNNDMEKDIRILSAGEKQLLVSAIVWSVFKLSNRNNIFVFDTPLARLDKENRALFVEKVLCTISDQVMILSTNEEIVSDLYSIVKSRISNEYLLVNNENTGKTEIKKGYF